MDTHTNKREDSTLRSLFFPGQSKYVPPEAYGFGLLSIGIYSLIIAIYIYTSVLGLSRSLQQSIDDFGFGGIFGDHINVQVYDYLFLPFVGFFGLQLMMILLIFASLRLSKSPANLKQITAQYGSFLIPFSLVFVLGVILSFLSLNWLAAVAIIIGTIGVIFVMPVLLSESSENEQSMIERLISLIAIYFIGLIVLTFVSRSYIEAMMSTFLDSFFGIFS